MVFDIPKRRRPVHVSFLSVFFLLLFLVSLLGSFVLMLYPSGDILPFLFGSSLLAFSFVLLATGLGLAHGLDWSLMLAFAIGVFCVLFFVVEVWLVGLTGFVFENVVVLVVGLIIFRFLLFDPSTRDFFSH
jgi:hypothetical protein